MVSERGVRDGQYVHAGTQVISVEPVDNGGTRITSEGTMEVEGGARPVLVAETIGVSYE